MEEQFRRHHGAQKRSYYQEETVWVRDYCPEHEKWIPARVKNRKGRAICVEKSGGELAARRLKLPACRSTRKTKNQYHGVARAIVDAKDNVKDRDRLTIVPQTTARPARHRRSPRLLQADPKMKTYAMRSS
ncbi:hypothetical protein RB195_022776 [Necator americanus]|uniref:Uncharacterized protein n=1 Tax=Necator americanus TaxID=51031 RepID=A0ABR1EGL9_NECAM